MDEARFWSTRRWAAGLARGDGANAAAGRTILSLLHAVETGSPIAPDQLREMRARARKESGGDDAELRAAARAVLALAAAVDEGSQWSHFRGLRRASQRLKFCFATHRRAGTRLIRVGMWLRFMRSWRVPVGRRTWLLVFGALAAAAVFAGAVAAARRMLAPQVSVRGPPNGALFGTHGMRHPRFISDATAKELAQQRWKFDGRDVTRFVRASGGILDLRPAALRQGRHTVVVRSAAGFLGSRTVARFWFRVDTRPPPLSVAMPVTARVLATLTVRGTTERGARVTVNGVNVRVEDRRFALTRKPPPPRQLVVTALDAAGNRTQRRVRVSLVPRRPAVAIRAVHVTSYAWSNPALRRGVMNLIAERRINAVELDLKDESGIVGFPADNALGRRIGAVQRIYDLRRAVRMLHARGIRVIGRLVCFRDPILAAASWRAGRRDEVVQTPAGGPYAGYGGFTNFANVAVRRYNIAIAVAAARVGVDDVLYDYVRRPDGPLSSMRFPGLRASPEAAIVEFLRESRVALRPYRTYLGASVFGVAATRPWEVAQPIRRMARNVDYIAPMLYPSHWGAGEYNVANPNAQPYDIVLRSLRDFSRDVAGTGARLVPWLQDFSLGVTYGAAEVQAQIRAAHRNGLNEFILWDPAVTYTADALTTDAHTAREGLATPWEGDAKSNSRPRATPPVAPPPVRRVGGRMPNELGVIPVIMHHEIRPDRVGAYDQTPGEFRAELEQLWREDYWPVTAADLVHRKLQSVPAGKTPVVLTFDDATRYQLTIRGGKVDPSTAVGVLLDFARAHPGFRPVGTFYVLREPFGGVADGDALLRWLVRRGFELGNHTKDHVPLSRLSPAGVSRELALGEAVITSAFPGYRVSTLSLPLGEMPKPASLARTGRWRGKTYGPYGVFLVGANPAPSPYSTDFEPGAIPRIRSSHLPWKGQRDFCAAFWLNELARHPEQRYVSDGDPAHITFPRERSAKLRPQFRRLARPF